jgi:hypothetical protein
MLEDNLLPFSFPAVERKKVTAAFDGGRIGSVSARASRYSRFDEGEIFDFQTASRTRKTVAVRRRKWNLR